MAMLVYADADGVERSVLIGAEPVLVGRANECAIRSSDPRVSRNHARFYVDATGVLYIEDLGSSNGIYVGPHRVMHSPVPFNEYVVVGSLVFRLVQEAPPPVAPPPSIPPPQKWLAAETQPAAHAYMPPVAAPPPAAAPMGGYVEPDDEVGSPSVIVDASAVDPVANERAGRLAAEQERDAERAGRLVAEQERDAYGARMAELHGELRALREAINDERNRLLGELSASARRIKELETRFSGSQPAISVEDPVQRVIELTDQLRAAEAREASTLEELAVARADLLAAEQRIVTEVAAQEERSAAELASRIEELSVTRSDLIRAEDRVVDLSRTIAELEQKLALR